MRNLILVDFSAVVLETASTRNYVIEYLYRHPDTALVVIDAAGNPKEAIRELLGQVQFPFDAVINNKAGAAPDIFKKALLESIVDNGMYAPILVIDTDEEALKMFTSAGVPFVYSPLSRQKES